MLHDSTILGEIYRLNRTYLMMLNRYLQEDFAAAMDEFGLAEEIARELANNTPEKIDRLARTTQLLLRFKFNEAEFLRALGEKSGPASAQHIEAGEFLACSGHNARRLDVIVLSDT